MLPEIALEALQFFDRDALEGLQVHSRFLRDLVRRHARTFLLRCIHHVEVLNGDVRIQVLEPEVNTIDVTAAEEPVLNLLFHCVNNAFVHRLTLTFRREDLPLPFYLRANAGDLQCQIGALHINGTEAEIDYALVDFLGINLRPHSYETMIWSEIEASDLLINDYATLFTRNTLHDNVKHFVCEIYTDPAPECIIPELFGVGVLETCAIITRDDPLPWIAKFIEAFRMTEGGTDIVRSVTLLYERYYEISPFNPVFETVGEPQRNQVPTPHSAFIKEHSRKEHLSGRIINESTVADRFVFESAERGEKLEVFVWALEQVTYAHQFTYLNYAFLMQVVDI